MKLKALFLLVLPLLLVGNSVAQKKPKPKLPTAKAIIQNYVKAIGGHDAIKKQTSRQLVGTLEMAPMGLKGTVEVWSVAPNKSHSRTDIAGIGEIIEAYDGKVAWSSNPLQGFREKSGNELLQTQIASDFYRDINFEKHYPKIRVDGIEKIGGKDAYVVVATPQNLPEEIFYFDKKTWLLVRHDGVVLAPEGNLNTQTTFDDYRVVDGIRIPFKSRIKTAQYEIVVALTEIKHGGQPDDSIFAQPK